VREAGGYYTDRAMPQSTSDVLRRLEENAPAIRRYGVRSLGLFGSGASVDFVVEFETKSFGAYMDLKAFLEQLFGSPVDVLREAIKPRLREAILKEARHAPGL